MDEWADCADECAYRVAARRHARVNVDVQQPWYPCHAIRNDTSPIRREAVMSASIRGFLSWAPEGSVLPVLIELESAGRLLLPFAETYSDLQQN